jgi:hypothetical protein
MPLSVIAIFRRPFTYAELFVEVGTDTATATGAGACAGWIEDDADGALGARLPNGGAASETRCGAPELSLSLPLLDLDLDIDGSSFSFLLKLRKAVPNDPILSGPRPEARRVKTGRDDRRRLLNILLELELAGFFSDFS